MFQSYRKVEWLLDVCEVRVELQDFISSNVRYQSLFDILKESPRSLTASKAGNLACSLGALILNYRIYFAIRRGFPLSRMTTNN